MCMLTADGAIAFIRLKGNGVFLVAINGTVKLGDIALNKRDAVGISAADNFTITASEDAELLAIEVPMGV